VGCGGAAVCLPIGFLVQRALSGAAKVAIHIPHTGDALYITRHAAQLHFFHVQNTFVSLEVSERRVDLSAAM
jgi:hypothetical protein